MTKKLFISWISFSRRSQLIAEKFQATLYLVHSLKRRSYLAPLRYLLQSVKTFRILVRERPAVVFVQNPPIFAPLVVYLYAKLYGARYVIDSHTAALLGGAWRWLLPLHAFLSRRALTTIVTNEHLAALVQAWGAPTFILADIPTVFPEGKPYPLTGRFSLAVINTFAPDEPIEEVLKAAAALPDVTFYVTGDPVRANKTHLLERPANVKFTGFLPDAEYLGLLQSVPAIMVLTTRDHTMQRGACEAVSLGKPIITSNWPLLKAYFHRGTVHVDNTAAGIQAGVLRMQREQETLAKEILVLQHERRIEWEEKSAEMLQLIEGRADRGPDRQEPVHAH